MPPQNRVSVTTPQMPGHYTLSPPSSPESSSFNVINEIIHPLQPNSKLHRHNRKSSYDPKNYAASSSPSLRTTQEHSLSPHQHVPYEPTFKYKPIPTINLIDDNHATKNPYSIGPDINYPRFTSSSDNKMKNSDNILYNNPNKIPTLHSPLRISPIPPLQIKPEYKTSSPFRTSNLPDYHDYKSAKSSATTMSTINPDHYSPRTSLRVNFKIKFNILCGFFLWFLTPSFASSKNVFFLTTLSTRSGMRSFL